MNQETTQVRINRSVHKKLKREAFELATTIKELVTEAVEEYLAGNTEHNAINRSEIEEMSEKEPIIW